MIERTEQYSDQVARLFPDKDRRVRVVTFQVTDACNLACTYCYQINKNHNRMPFDVAKRFVDMLLDADENSCGYISTANTSGVEIEFIGGEPLLEIDLISQITDYFISEMIRRQHPWATRYRLSVCSNGVLYFDPRWQAYMKRHWKNLSFSISIDGCKSLHDSCRVFPDGSGSYDLAMKGVRHFVDVLGGSMGSKMTLAPGNIEHTYEAIVGLIESGYTDINLNCVYEDGWNDEYAAILYRELKKAADYLLEHDLYDDVQLSIFNQRMFHPKAEDDLQNWCGGDGSMISVDYKGDIYPCIRYMESSLGDDQEPLIIGNVWDGIMTKPEQCAKVGCLKAIDRRTQSTDECFYCPIAEGCSWCFPSGTKIKTPNGLKNIEDISEGDCVLDGFGNTQRVLSNMSRHSRDLTYVNACGVFPTLVTKDHPFYAKKVVKKVGNLPVYGDPEWVNAKDLQVTDRIALPLHSFGDVDFDKNKAFVLGMYLGDGWKTPSKRKAHPFTYYICCDKRKSVEIASILEKAGIQYGIGHNRTVDEFHICITGNESLIELFDDCGRYAKDKHLPEAVYQWNGESVKALLDGYFFADGNINRGNQRYTTISKSLLLGIGEMVKAVHHKPVYYTVRTYTEKGSIEGRTVNLSESYTGSFMIGDGARKGYEYDEVANILWVNVRSCKKECRDEELVYNLTVENTHAYVANEMLVHNCTAYNYQVFGTPDKRATYICEMHKARALANAYYWNKVFRKKCEPKRFKIYVPEDWALKIVDLDEWTMLKRLESVEE